MTWTYGNNPETIAKDEIRYLVGDTDNTEQLTTDEEIAYAISKEGNNMLAAARVAKSIAAKFSRQSDMKIGDLEEVSSQKSKQYFELAYELQQRGQLTAATPYVGGLSQAEKDAAELDSDLVQPKFTKNIHNNPKVVDSTRLSSS